MERLGEWTVLLVRQPTTIDALLDAVEAKTVRCDVIRGDMITSRLHLAVAMQRLVTTKHLAIKANSDDTTARLMFGLALKGATALKTFAYTSESPTALIALRQPTSEDVAKVVGLVGGTAVPLDELEAGANHDAIARYYGVGKAERETSPLTSSVVSRIAVADL